MLHVLHCLFICSNVHLRHDYWRLSTTGSLTIPHERHGAYVHAREPERGEERDRQTESSMGLFVTQCFALTGGGGGRGGE